MARAARVLADWCAGLSWNEIPEKERGLAGLRVLDTIGLALVARRSEAGRIAESIARRHGGTPEATLAGSSERLPASWAAFGHGVLAHANDFDDTFALSVVHPGSVVLARLRALELPARRRPLASLAAFLFALSCIGPVAQREFTVAPMTRSSSSQNGNFDDLP